MYSQIISLLLPVLALASPVPQAAPSPNEIAIVGGNYSGNGCANGVTITTVGKATFRFSFNHFRASIGPNSTASENSKKCAMHFDLKYPEGFQYAVVDATYRGYARLEKGTTGSFLTKYYFSQSPVANSTNTARMTVNGGGPLSGGQFFTKRDSFNATAVNWSPCNTIGTLNIDASISLSSTDPSASGEMSISNATVPFTQALRLQTRPCVSG